MVERRHRCRTRARSFPRLRRLRAGSSSAPSAVPRPLGGARVSRHRTGAGRGHQGAGRHARRRDRHAVQPPGEHAGLAGGRQGWAVSAELPVRRRARDHRPHRQPERVSDRRAARPANRSSAGAPTRKSARSSSRRTRCVVVSRRHVRGPEAVRRRLQPPRQLHDRAAARTSIRSRTCPTSPKAQDADAERGPSRQDVAIDSRCPCSSRSAVDGPRRRPREGRGS